MNKLINRLSRFLNASCVLGWKNALVIFLSFSSNVRFIKILGVKFFFRGRVDKGVMSHFYKIGYYINDVNSKKKINFIVDAGANIGDETLRFYIHNKNSKIIAIEPEKSNFNILKKNFDANNRVSLINSGLWSKKTKLKIIQNSASMESFQVFETNDNDFTINAIDIISIMKDNDFDEIDILKLDIECAENELFTNNYKNWINKINCIILEVSDCNKNITQKLYRILDDNFTTYINGENIILIKDTTGWKVENVIGFKI
jgi:FkbM family methyltransferase